MDAAALKQLSASASDLSVSDSNNDEADRLNTKRKKKKLLQKNADAQSSTPQQAKTKTEQNNAIFAEAQHLSELNMLDPQNYRRMTPAEVRDEALEIFAKNSSLKLGMTRLSPVVAEYIYSGAVMTLSGEEEVAVPTYETHYRHIKLCASRMLGLEGAYGSPTTGASEPIKLSGYDPYGAKDVNDTYMALAEKGAFQRLPEQRDPLLESNLSLAGHFLALSNLSTVQSDENEINARLFSNIYEHSIHTSSSDPYGLRERFEEMKIKSYLMFYQKVIPDREITESMFDEKDRLKEVTYKYQLKTDDSGERHYYKKYAAHVIPVTMQNALLLRSFNERNSNAQSESVMRVNKVDKAAETFLMIIQNLVEYTKENPDQLPLVSLVYGTTNERHQKNDNDEIVNHEVNIDSSGNWQSAEDFPAGFHPFIVMHALPGEPRRLRNTFYSDVLNLRPQIPPEGLRDPNTDPSSETSVVIDPINNWIIPGAQLIDFVKENADTYKHIVNFSVVESSALYLQRCENGDPMKPRTSANYEIMSQEYETAEDARSESFRSVHAELNELSIDDLMRDFTSPLHPDTGAPILEDNWWDKRGSRSTENA